MKKKGSEIEIQCTPPAPPSNNPQSKSKITKWFKNGEVFEPIDVSNIIITKRDFGERSYLHIKEAGVEDSANYSCLAKNEGGEKISSSSEIVIYGIYALLLTKFILIVYVLARPNFDGHPPVLPL